MARIIGTNVRYVDKCVCSSCRVLFEYDGKDIQVRTVEHSHGRESSYNYVPCPGCGRECFPEKKSDMVYDPVETKE
jgi:hypothetical protein